ncbi:AEC family transporter [Staphylococcus massiliensis]|uniref:AEC family transporter n=1 Tax=Staphylococcus massiliensis TaxID=555791 RepID=UPI001EDD8351|nr:AEC family transporter [Staphylococcus massiliensis]MCG3399238.1 AEC family transporter [Staphylococcus massiliensis]
MTAKFLIIIALITFGYFLKRIHFIKPDDTRFLSRLVLNVTLPCLVIVTLNKAELNPSLTILPILMVLYGIISKIAIIYFFIRYDNEMRGSVGMMMGSMNIGLFAYPLVQQIWPENGMIYFGMADIGGAFIMFGVTYFVASYFKDSGNQFNFKYLGLNLLKSVPLMTYLTMFVLNLANIHLPKGPITFFETISLANLPLSMILIGSMLDFRIERKFLPVTLKYLSFHYGFGLVAGLLVQFFLPVSDDMIKTTLQVIWLLPVAVAVIPYTLKFNYRTAPVIAMNLNITIIISIFIIYFYQMIFV